MRAIVKEKTIVFLATAGLWLAASIWFCGQTVAKDSISIAAGESRLLQVTVYRLIVDPASKQPVVVLADSPEERGLLIWIDYFEANAINSEMEEISHRRPLTHDLLESIIQKANLNIQRVIISHLDEGIYYATILIERGSSLMEIDARPSDSIVMALKFNVPIFVSEKLFRDASIPLVEQEAVEERYGLTFQELTPSLAKAFSFGSTRGVLVSGVTKQSRAEKDGIERGDIFVEVGGQATKDLTSMRNALKKSKPPVEATIFRKAHFISITIHPN